jgi:hypothetical protein
MIRKIGLMIAGLALVFLVATPVPAHAWTPFGGIDCSGDPTKAGDPAHSAACQDAAKQNGDPNNSNPLTGANGLLMKIANIVAVVAGVAAVIIIILAGLRYIQAGGSTEDIAGARRTIIYAVAGLVIIVLGRTIIAFVLRRI